MSENEPPPNEVRERLVSVIYWLGTVLGVVFGLFAVALAITGVLVADTVGGHRPEPKTTVVAAGIYAVLAVASWVIGRARFGTSAGNGGLVRLANVLYELGTGLAAAFGIFALIASAYLANRHPLEEMFGYYGIPAVLAVASWGIGRAARYFLAGR